VAHATAITCRARLLDGIFRGRVEFQEGVFTREHIAARAVGQIVAPHRRLANDGAIVLNLLDLLQMVGSEAVSAI
jgi:hypothetical protein